VEKVRTVAEEDILVVERHSRSRMVVDEQISGNGLPTLTGHVAGQSRAKWIVGGVLAVALGAVAGYLYLHRGPKLTNKDTVVLGDFVNTTGDSIFDGALRQGLSSQLEQSPFLNLLSDRRIAQTLSLMARPKDAQLTNELAHEVCQRTASAAVLEGSIAQVGTRYLLTLKAVNCASGENLASAQAQASDKNHILDALGKVAADIRPKLGESLASVQKYDAPLPDVTTPSLEALQAYSLGHRAWIVKNDSFAAIPFFQRAVTLDPNFAMAYAGLGTLYDIVAEASRATENLQKAYDLRERVSEREKLRIAAIYDAVVTQDLEAARTSYELSARIYPRDGAPLNNLGVIYSILGYYDKALTAQQAALKLDPANATTVSNIVGSYICLNRIADASALARQQVQHVDSPDVHGHLYMLDFLLHDAAGMEREVAWLTGKPGWEDSILRDQADTAAYGGRFAQARDLTQRAVDSAQRANRREPAAAYEAKAAVREALVGNLSLAKQQARAALELAKDADVKVRSAVALGLADDPSQVVLLSRELSKAFPKGTIAQRELLPMIHAAAVLRRDPRQAIEALAVSTPYELGETTLILFPVYLRGEAYLVAKQGTAAAAEFQKILAQPGLVTNELIGALAHLELGRAYALTGDMTKAKAAYQNFLSLWKDADPDIPILKQAKAEYAKLR
jgi:tetratricopeptide (TPR) repeat protein